MPGRKPIPVGSTFARLTVIAPAGYECCPCGVRHYFVKAKCICGNIVEVREIFLRQGHTKSCGCLQKEIVAFNSHKRKGIGITKENPAEYRIWCAMVTRCSNPNQAHYKHYGGRGIKICDRWRSSFKHFLADMGSRPPNHSLGRIDNDGDYSPSNCRWETPAMQSRNSRNNRNITWNGVTKCLSDWAKSIGINRKALWHRLDHLKWPLERALSTPSKRWRANYLKARRHG